MGTNGKREELVLSSLSSTKSTKDKRGKKTNKTINEVLQPTVTVHIVHKCTILHPLMWVFFLLKMCKISTFFYFAQLCIN